MLVLCLEPCYADCGPVVLEILEISRQLPGVKEDGGVIFTGTWHPSLGLSSLCSPSHPFQSPAVDTDE